MTDTAVAGDDAGTVKPDVAQTPQDGTVAGSEAKAGQEVAAKPEDALAALMADDTPATKEAPKFPEDWREQMAGGDEAALKLLKRYSTPSNAARALVEAREKIAKGSRIEKPSDPADEKAMAEWRKAAGVPDKPEAYQMPKVTGFEWSDIDKPVVGQFFEFAHKEGLPQAAADVALKWYADFQTQQVAAMAEADKGAKEEALNMLAGEWGADLRANTTLATKFLEKIPGLGRGIAEFRGPDGRRLGDSPDFIKWAADQGREFFGDSTFIGANGSATMGDRKAALEQLMKTNFEEYERTGGPAEMRKILELELARKR